MEMLSWNELPLGAKMSDLLTICEFGINHELAEPVVEGWYSVSGSMVDGKYLLEVMRLEKKLRNKSVWNVGLLTLQSENIWHQQHNV